ncbi:MAG: extracellular solute-binding protein [Armatimonadetes bacterium]|nr:extracellular solute-binding protein [Armatimonadota bacterium]MDE2207119.1 extracellular solute-binding protein [Armatimonadota bacterium]
MTTRKLAALIAALGTFLGLNGCAARRLQPKTTLVVWGLEFGDETKGLEAEIDAFEKMHPGVAVSVLSMGAGSMNPQKLMTAIVGGTPPDVIRQDRFTIGDWAIRDAFTPLDGFLAHENSGPFAVRPADYYAPCWREATFTNPFTHQSSVYAIPTSTDDRALLFNKTLFRQAGIVDSRGHARPPQTWDELYADAVKLTQFNGNGGYTRIGFIPNYGNAWLYLYSWENDGSFLSPDGRTCTLASPANVGALQYMVKMYDALGGVDRVSAFQSGFQENELDPFLTGQVAMKVDDSGVAESIARYGPDLDFGVAPAPVPAARLALTGRFKHDTDRFVTWSGGYSFAIPRGARHLRLAWQFIQWMCSPQAALVDARAQQAYNRSKQRAFVPGMSANRLATAAVFAKYMPANPRFRAAMEGFLKLLPHARFRPVTFVGQRLWDEQVRAFDNATHHRTTGMTPRAALTRSAAVVQRELDAAWSVRRLPRIHRPVIVAFWVLCGAILLYCIASVWVRVARLRRLARAEAIAGYLFAAPWLVGLVGLTLGPIVVSLALSFCSYDVLHPARWAGLQNYTQLLGQDRYYLLTSLNNVLYIAAIGIPLGIATGLAVAMLLNAKVSGMSFYRTCFYLPSIVPVVASALLWWWLLNGDPNRGLVDAAWQLTLGHWFGLKPPGWFNVPEWAKPGLILQGLWGAGSGMILWLAGLQGIPQHLYEVASLDGANWWRKFVHVTVPMLSPYILFNLVMGTIGALQEFDRVYVLSGGDPSSSVGPVDSLLMPVIYLFKNAFQYFKMGYASAIAWILFVIILVLTLIQLKLAPLWVYYEGEKK